MKTSVERGQKQLITILRIFIFYRYINTYRIRVIYVLNICNIRYYNTCIYRAYRPRRRWFLEQVEPNPWSGYNNNDNNKNVGILFIKF